MRRAPVRVVVLPDLELGLVLGAGRGRWGSDRRRGVRWRHDVCYAERMTSSKPLCATFACLMFASTLAGCDDVGEGPGGAGGKGTTSSSTTTSTNGSTSSTGGGACSASMPCEGGQYCLFATGDCSATAIGTCQGILQCDGPETGPACSCEGTVVEAAYGDCSLVGMSKPVGPAAPCQTGTFACGATAMCKRNAEICERTSGGVMGNETFVCKALGDVPNTCSNGIPSCGCITGSGGQMCTEDADHQETIQILAP